MAYRELIKNFEGIRSYMREFYVCGFKSREEYREKSARSYDNERRRIESWLGAYMSFRQDASSKTVFLFKHHYILRALDSDVLCDLLLAIDQRRAVELEVRNPRTGCGYQRTVCPLKIYISTQSGRQYLLGYKYRGRRMAFFRLDAIRQVKPGCLDEQYDTYLSMQEKFDRHLWGVSAGTGRRLDHIEMTVHYGPGEEFILQRLRREKRHGTVEILERETCRFTADVYDATELLPWLRTFLGRIVEFRCSNPAVEEQFYEDLQRMNALYGGGEDAVQ